MPKMSIKGEKKMKKIEDKINEWVEYFVEEFVEDDYNIYKIEIGEDVNVEMLDEKLLSEYISSMWKDRNYLYVELNYSMLLEKYRHRQREWERELNEWNEYYWSTRGL